MTTVVNMESNPGNYAILHGKLFMRRASDAPGAWVDIGEVEKANVAVQVEVAEHYSHRTGIAELDAQVPTKIAVELSLTCSEITSYNLANYFQASITPYTQAAATSETMTIDNVVAETTYDLGVTDLTSVTITDDSSGHVPYVLGTNYNWDDAGTVTIVALPTGATENAIVTYSASAVSDPNRGVVELLTTPMPEVGLMLVGTNAYGPRFKYQTARCFLRATGGVDFIADDFAKIELTGKVLRDPALTFGAYGKLTQLAPINAISS